MQHYAFLREGAVATLTEFRWPVPNGSPGDWVEAGRDAPADAIRGCTLGELPAWLDDELWEVELGGRITSEGRCVFGERGRLLRRIESWTPAQATSFLEACAARVEAAVATLADPNAERMRGFADDVRLYAAQASTPGAAAAVAAYVAAHALAGGDRTVRTYASNFEQERRWQAEWLKERLSL